MPEQSKERRASGGYSSAPRPDDGSVRLPWDDWPALEIPDQSRYGAATTDPLGREGPGWHMDGGIPVLEKGWRYDKHTHRTTMIPGGYADPNRKLVDPQ